MRERGAGGGGRRGEGERERVYRDLAGGLSRQRLVEATPVSAYVSIRLHTSAYVSIRQQAGSGLLKPHLCQHMSAYVIIRQHTKRLVEAAPVSRGAVTLNFFKKKLWGPVVTNPYTPHSDSSLKV